MGVSSGEVMSESGGSAELKAAALAAAGDSNARAWALGAEGERRVAEALKALPDGWVALHDRLLYPGVTDSNIDHVVIGPGGIFMIDAKNRGGDLTVYLNFLYQHTVTPDGQKQSTNLQSEVAKAAWIVKEMSSRLTVTVVPVLCLAGSRSHKFTSPQFVQDVSVVSVEHLVEWLTVQAPRMPSAHQPAWVRQVMTEFPSTTTDPELLAVMAPSMLARKGNAPRASRAPRQRGARPPSARSRNPAQNSRPARRARKRKSPALFLMMGLAVMVAVLLVGGGGAAVLGSAFSKAFTGTATSGRTATSDSRGLVGGDDAALTSSAPHVPTCAPLKVDDLAGLAAIKITKAALPICNWSFPAADGSSRDGAIQLDVLGDKSTYDPMLKETIALGQPKVSPAYGLNGRKMFVTVAKGQTADVGSGPEPFSRNLRLEVDYERLGFSEEQGQSLALAFLLRADQLVQSEMATQATK